MTFRYRDPKRFRELVDDLVKRFPTDTLSINALNSVADDTENVQERAKVLERIRGMMGDAPAYAMLNTGSSAANTPMNELLNLYALSGDLNKAQAFAEGMLKAVNNSKEWEQSNRAFNMQGQRRIWQDIVDYEKRLINAQSLIAQQESSNAVALLQDVKTPRGIDLIPLQLLQAKAVAGAGDTQKAYDTLAKIVAKQPEEPLMAALLQYGKQLNKSAQDVQAELWQLRTEKAAVLKDFELTDFRTGKKVKLSDYRGRVVLVTFWFPHCGYCLVEFPYFQSVLEKYESKGFAILAPNINTEEDDLVLQVMNRSCPKNDASCKPYGFVPLQAPRRTWADDEYKVRKAPVNYLLSADGRIIFQPNADSKETQKLFEQALDVLLDQAKEAKKDPSDSKGRSGK
jgi:thiol-disulfide isomerase/thioredoxin